MSYVTSDKGPILTYANAGTHVPTAFLTNPTAASIRYIGIAADAVIWVKFTTDAASNFSSYDLQFVDSYDGSDGSWIPNTTVESVNDVAGSTQNVLLSVGATIWTKFQTANTRLSPGGCSVFIRGNGGAVKTGDAAIIYLAAA